MKLATNKKLLIGLGALALAGILYISYTATQVTKTLPTTHTATYIQHPKVAKMIKPVTDTPVSGQIIIKFNPAYSQEQISNHLLIYHASIIKTIEGINQTVVKVPNGQENAIEQEMKNDPYVVTVQRDYTTHAFFTPNDPLFTQQYAFNNTGQSVLGQTGTANADIHAEQAWNTTEGNGVKVAILDTGINLNQPDLAGKVILQKSFVSATVEDGNGHGTHVAGILSADTNNGNGVAGTCPGCQLIIGKILDDTGSGTTSNATAGITWAADNGAKVINMSLGTTDASTESLYLQAVNYAMSKGAIVVAASGNDGTNGLNYPAAVPGVVSVAATTNTDSKASYSNYGSTVDIAAPGDNIISTGPTHSFELEPFGYSTATPYYYLSGTSMATPIVSGVAALIASTSYGTSPQTIVNRLYSTADKISGTGTYWTYGRVNAAAAVGIPPTTGISPTSSIITPTLYCEGGAGVPPCATIGPNGNAGSPTYAAGNSNTTVSTAPGVSGTPNNGTGSLSPTVSGGPQYGGGTPAQSGQVCANLTKFFNGLSSTGSQTDAKVHIKCQPSGGGGGGNSHGGGYGGNGGGNNGGVNGGWLSKFIALLIQLIMQLLQLCVGQTPTTGTPTVSGTPAISPTQAVILSPSVGSPSSAVSPTAGVSQTVSPSTGVSQTISPSGGAGVDQ